MKAVFVHKHVILRDSHLDPQTSFTSWQLAPATLEAMRLLAKEDILVLLYGSASLVDSEDAENDRDFKALVRQIEAGGGRVDGLIICSHQEGDNCRCWGEFPGLLWIPASQFGLQLEECYVLGDEERDVITAYAAGARPLIVLCGRSIVQIFGDLPNYKDFPIAENLTTAVNYIETEEDIAQQLGHPRTVAPPIPADEELYAEPETLPELVVRSRFAHNLQAQVRQTKAQLQDIGRWLSFLVAGAVGLSLGIAYLLTHLYRVQPFPSFVYYLTLQFIPRPIRGALFIALGLGVTSLAIHSLYRSINLWRKR